MLRGVGPAALGDFVDGSTPARTSDFLLLRRIVDGSLAGGVAEEPDVESPCADLALGAVPAVDAPTVPAGATTAEVCPRLLGPD